MVVWRLNSHTLSVVVVVVVVDEEGMEWGARGGECKGRAEGKGRWGCKMRRCRDEGKVLKR